MSDSLAPWRNDWGSDSDYPPQIVAEGDTARAPLDGPQTSHDAADKSAETKSAVEAAILSLIRINGPLTGSQLNDKYRSLAFARDWPFVHFDSPRKRAGDLARRRALTVTNSDAKRGTESIYALPENESQDAA